MSQETRSPYPRMALIIFAVFGFLDSLYLTLTRLQPEVPLACVVGGGCETVQSSPWSTIPPGNGLPIAFIGVGGYLVLLVLGLISLQTDKIGEFPMPIIVFAISSIGILFSLYLVAVQVLVIQAICFWCMMSAFFELCIWIAAFIDWQQWK